MNKRLKKKMDKSKREAVHALLDTVLDINGLAPRERVETGELPTVFMNFSGHIGRIWLSVHSRGWYPDESADFQADVKSLDSHKIQELNDTLRTRYL